MPSHQIIRWLAISVLVVSLLGISQAEKPSQTQIAFSRSLTTKVKIGAQDVTIEALPKSDDKNSSWQFKVSMQEQTFVLELPERRNLISGFGVISDIRATAYMNHAIALAVNVEQAGSNSLLLMILRYDETNSQQPWSVLNSFLALQLFDGIELGHIGNPESDSLVVTAFHGQPVPGTDQHLMITLRNDCPVFEDIPFRKKLEYISTASLTDVSQQRIKSARR